MLASATPVYFQQPFANNAGVGYTRAIPNTTADTTAASLNLGFPPACFVDVALGGTPPNGMDFNGIFNEITANIQWIQAGGFATYNSAFSTAIGGYPNGAILAMANGKGLWRSTADNNVTDPDTSGAGWVAESIAPGAYLDLSVAGNTDVTLTAVQAANNIIDLTGILTGNINVIVPTATGQWTFVNSTTGAFIITIKTAAGTGVVIPQRSTITVYCDGTNVIANISALPTIVSVNGGQVSGIRERTINGDMSVSQKYEATIVTFVAAAAITNGIVDKFYGSCTGANVTGAQVAGTAPDSFAYQFTGAASVTGILFGQRYKSDTVSDMVNQNVSFSVKLSNSLLTTATWTAYYANVKDVFSAKTQIATGTFTIGTTPDSYHATFNAGANAANGICIEVTVGAQTSGTFDITEWSFKIGTVLEAFERMPKGLNLLLCRGYYRKTFAQGQVPVNNIGNVNGCLMGFHQNTAIGPAAYWAFDPPMEGTPTLVTTYDPYVADSNWNVAGGGTSNTAVVGTATNAGVNITSSTTTGTNYSYIHASAEYAL